ncbi:MAG: GtrA family protein [Clostridia bacterium]|nr:GtrA family protein [Clostridia bacterium]
MRIKNEFTKYIFFGVLTTLVNYFSYWCYKDVLMLSLMLANGLAFFTAVLFAYITNRKWVFKSSAHRLMDQVKECTTFYLARCFGFVVDMSIMFVGVKLLSMNDLFVKVSANILVIVVNYLVSKFVVFKSIEYNEVKNKEKRGA